MAANYVAQLSVNSGTGCYQQPDKNRHYLLGCTSECVFEKETETQRVCVLVVYGFVHVSESS